MKNDIAAAMRAIAKREPLPTVKPLIVTEADNIPCRFTTDVDTETIYLVPKGSPTPNLQTGQTLCLLPRYYVNPRQCGVITNVKETK